LIHDGSNIALLPVPFNAFEEECRMIARDIMTHKVYTIRPGATVQEVAQLLDRHRISGVPVVNADNHIIGVVTEADIISKVSREGLLVSDIMSTEPIVIDEEMPVGDIAALLTERKIKRVPVVCGNKITGIVSRGDIVQAVAQGHLIIRSW
jgi:CBS domain-containing protein